MDEKHLPLSFAAGHQIKKPKSSGLQTRFSDSAQQFRLTHQKSQRQIQMNSIITGKTDEVVVPRPGEFLLISQHSQRKLGPNDAVNREDLEKIMQASSVSLKSMTSQKMLGPAKKAISRRTPRRQQSPGQKSEDDDLVLHTERPKVANSQ